MNFWTVIDIRRLYVWLLISGAGSEVRRLYHPQRTADERTLSSADVLMVRLIGICDCSMCRTGGYPIMTPVRLI